MTTTEPTQTQETHLHSRLTFCRWKTVAFELFKSKANNQQVTEVSIQIFKKFNNDFSYSIQSFTLISIIQLIISDYEKLNVRVGEWLARERLCGLDRRHAESNR